ncbi:DUF4013 domain-containing protein [Methanobrevibacter woesei]|uniref:DUF4013 domain-containing protein n=1 Tax=Methanobrevibacter woesei TaxID=190976 RepID=UPI0023F1608E|nr:DUF4013 domain-containing protein [Methanobrevibacter woesei]
MILEIYKDAFSYALKDGSTLLKLGVLSLFSFLIIPFIFLLGYEYRIIKTATEGMINGNETLPEFNNYTTMFKDGLKVLAVSIIYVLISVVIFLLLFFTGLTTNMESIIVLAFIALIILTIISLIFSALAVTHMVANNGSINAAFHIRELKDIMQSIGVLKLVGSYFGIFLINAVISFVVYIFVFAVVGILGFAVSYVYVDIVPAFIWALSIIADLVVALVVWPYLNIFSCRSYGLIYNLRE